MQNYHKHSCYSESDSAAMLEDYAKRAVELGQKVLSSVEHGWQGYYYGCFELAKKYNLKFVFGTEAYWVKDRKEQDKTNAHIIILAKNENGRRAINRILSDANETGFYYKPRVDLELLLSLPKNDVFLTSACFEPNTRVLIGNQMKNIQDIQTGDFVLTHKGRKRRVITPTERLYDGTMYELDVEGCFNSVKCTKDHLFPTIQKTHNNVTNNIVWKKAADLSLSDRILDAIDSSSTALKQINVNEIIGDYRQDAADRKTHKSPIIKDHIDIDNLFLFILGLYVAEGSQNKFNNYLCFTLCKDEMDYYYRINEFAQKYLNKQAVIQNKTKANAMSVLIHSKEMALLFDKLIHCGAANKNIPDFVMQLPPCQQMQFIKGLFSGDGHVSKTMRRVNFVTISELLAQQALYILERNGLKTSCYVKPEKIDKNGVHHSKAYILEINSADFTKYWSNFLKEDEDFNYVMNGWNSKKPIQIDGVSYIHKKIKKIRPYHYSGLVHCLNVDEDESFRLDGISVHNCIAFWKYEDSESVAVKLHDYFGDNFLLEIQAHSTEAQRELSRKTKEISQKYGIRMIAGLDSHYIYPEESVERDDILAGRNIKYDDSEAGWYMDYPDEKTTMERFLEQGIFSKEEIQAAMDASDILLEFADYDDNILFKPVVKMPTLYPDKTQAEKNKIYSELISGLFSEYMKNIPEDHYQEYFEGIKKEVSTYKETNMVDYPLIDYEIVKKAVEKGGLITSTGRGCFTESATITTLSGIKSIKDVKIGDYVIDINGEPQRVVDTMDYDCNEPLVEIHYVYGPNKHNPLVCTPDHKILVMRNSKREWIEAQDLNAGDYVCSPFVKFPDKKTAYYDLADYNIGEYEIDEEYIYEKRAAICNDPNFNLVKIASKIGCSKSWVQATYEGRFVGDKARKNYLPKLLEITKCSNLEEFRKKVDESRTIKIKRFIENNEKLNKIIGMLYGDGWIREEIKEKNVEIGIAVSQTGKKQQINKQLFIDFFQELGLSYRSKKAKNKNLEQLYIKSAVLRNFFSQFFVSKKGREKIFKEDLFFQNPQNQKALLDGLLMTDGSFVDSEPYRINFDTTSLSLGGAVKLLSASTRMGITTMGIREAYKDQRGYNCQTGYKIRIMPNTDNRMKKSIQTITDNNYIYLPVLEIKKIDAKPTKVYDLTIENSHSYMINNIIVHNSAVGYMTNTLCGFSKVDRFTSPIKLYPERFISKTRILETNSLPDLDINTGNPDVFAEAQKEVLGDDHAYPMIAFGTLKKKSAFKLYARAAKMDFELANEISAQISKYDEALKNADDDVKDDIDIFDFVDKKYEDYIVKSQKYWGVVDHKNKAPCAYLLYGGSIREEIGLIRCKSEATGRDYITTVIDGAIAENYKFLKNDLLKVDVVYMIDKMFKRINKPILSTTELSNLVENDTAVWDLYANAYTIGVNQCEGEGSKQKLKRYKPRNISELCAWIAAIRPAFKSMYNKFESREPFEYGIPAFDNILQTPQFPYSFVLYQEQTMNTLNYAGFPLDECYGIIKAIAKKHPEKVKPLKERFLNGFKEKILKENNISESEADDMSAKVWQIINDSCGYGFNSAHAYCMALDSLYCAWLKVHYTYEFYEVLMQMYSDKGNKDKVQALKAEMKKAFGIKEGPYKWGVDNRRFVADRENGLIYPSLLSLKGFSQGCADVLYEMSQFKKYDSFLSLIEDITENKKDINSSRLDILIRLGYFSEFGPAKTLLKTVEYYNKYQCTGATKQFKKDSVPIEAIPFIEKYAAQETEKMYKLDKTGVELLLKEIVSSIPQEDLPLKEKLSAESEYLGYIATTIPDAAGNAFVTKVEQKGTNYRVSLYDIGTGDSQTVKLKKKTYQITPLGQDTIISYRLGEEYPWYKGNDGKFYQDQTKEKQKILIWYGVNHRWD